MVRADKARRFVSLPRALWKKLDSVAHHAGRYPGAQLEVILERYFAALQSGTPLGVDPTDAAVSRPLPR